MYPIILTLAVLIIDSGLFFICINNAVPLRIRMASCGVALALCYLGNGILTDIEKDDDDEDSQFPDGTGLMG